MNVIVIAGVLLLNVFFLNRILKLLLKKGIGFPAVVEKFQKYYKPVVTVLVMTLVLEVLHLLIKEYAESVADIFFVGKVIVMGILFLFLKTDAGAKEEDAEARSPR